MEETYIFAGGTTAACCCAVDYLSRMGLPITDMPSDHVRYLLLDVPSFGSDGYLRGGGRIRDLLTQLPKDILVCGGNLNHPDLAGYDCVDFLQDETYLCENAYITAECAIDVALPYLQRTLRHCPTLIIGWGRIGKCLGQLLRNMDADVTIAARNIKDRAMIHALGYHILDITEVPQQLQHFRLLYNTVPYPILSAEQLSSYENCIKIELASKNGIEGEDVIIARGLPGLHMPESSGKLIADTFIRLCYGR